MRKEMADIDIESVTGGIYFIDNTNTLYFKAFPDAAYSLKKSKYGAMEIMDNLIGKYSTDAEYDAACVEALQKEGYI